MTRVGLLIVATPDLTAEDCADTLASARPYVAEAHQKVVTPHEANLVLSSPLRSRVDWWLVTRGGARFEGASALALREACEAAIGFCIGARYVVEYGAAGALLVQVGWDWWLRHDGVNVQGAECRHEPHLEPLKARNTFAAHDGTADAHYAALCHVGKYEDAMVVAPRPEAPYQLAIDYLTEAKATPDPFNRRVCLMQAMACAEHAREMRFESQPDQWEHLTDRALWETPGKIDVLHEHIRREIGPLALDSMGVPC